MAAVGYEQLRQRLQLTAFEPRRIARVMPVTRLVSGVDSISVPGAVAPDPGGPLIEHVVFALKHEGTNLQILSQALPRIPAVDLEAVITASPHGQYGRMAASLWEHFNQRRLEVEPARARYVDLFDPDRYVTAESARRDERWRVRFNGLGSLDWCVTVERTESVETGLASNVLARTAEFVSGLDHELLDRTLSWAYLSETESSYAIEKEVPSESKAKAYVTLLRQAHDARILTEDYLAELQAATVSNPFDRAAEFRNEQNWLRGPGRGSPGVTYVPPPPDLALALMDELMRFANRASRVDPIVAASVVSFAFVFIHPFMDGNGRLSRFLFHHALCRSGRLPHGLLLPVSVAMQRDEGGYLAALRSYSRPARERVAVAWIDEGQYAFEFPPAIDSIYRYWDATACVEFGFRMAEQALEVELRGETRFLTRYDRVMREVNAEFDLRGSDLTPLVVAALDQGHLSNNKRQRYAGRVPAAAFDFIEKSVKRALDEDED